MDEDKLDIEDIESCFTSIQSQITSINERMLGMGIEFTNKMDSNIMSVKNKQFIQIRNSIQYRLNSILFHFTQLLKIQEYYQHKLQENTATEKSVLYLHQGSDQQYALFDSIVFHAVSLFDYLACMIYYSCSGKFEPKSKWNSILKTSRNPDSFLANSDLRLILQKWNNDFVNTLYGHRSDVIHHSGDFGDTGIFLNFQAQNLSLEVEAPYRFVKSFRELKKLSKEKKIQINFAVDWIINKSLESANEIIEGTSSLMEVKRKVPAGKEFFKFKKK